MKVAIHANPSRDLNFSTRDYLCQLLQNSGAKVILKEENYAEADLIMSLGGDGTFLSLAHIPTAVNVPCIGVNLGSVGFLTELERDGLPAAVEQILKGDYEIEERMMLKVEVYDGEGRLEYETEALNDLVLMRHAGGRIITTDISIDGMQVERIPGDGIIVSTPTGSTAYSLAAGGPIVHPAMNVILITPVCPHTLHNRSYIAPGSATIVLKLSDHKSTGVASADGKTAVKISTGMIKIHCSSRKFKILRLYGDKFYKQLPEKIQERGEVR